MVNSHSVLHKTCLLIGILLVIRDFYKWASIPEYIEENPKFSLLEPSDANLPEIEDVYSQLIDLKNFTFQVNPQPCRNNSAGILLLIMVITRPSHFENRDVIRRTWGQSTDSIKVVFLLGLTKNQDITEDLDNENSMYEDMVVGSFVDSYKNLTYKHVMALKWVTHHCAMAKYMVKTDDDTVVNINTMTKFLARELSPWGAKNLIMCDKEVHAKVERKKTKWKVTRKEYVGDYYPNYCRGFTIIYSQDVISRLLSAAQNAPYFWIDDVHVTGTLAQNASIEITALNTLFLTPNRAQLLIYLGGGYSGPFLYGSWDLAPHRMLQIWSALP